MEYIDIFRALGIVLMVMGHIGFGGGFDKWIHAFHMPMFFFVSGWFYKKKEIPLLLVLGKKFKTMLLPYMIIGVFELAISYLLFSKYSGVQPLKSFLLTNTDGQSPVPGALWFLTAMFFAELIYISADRALKNRILFHAFVVAISVFGTVAVIILPFRLPWGIDAGCVGIGFLHIGHLARENRFEKAFQLELWKVLLIGSAISISILLSPYVNMRTASYTGYPLFWLNALIAIAVGWNLAKYINLFLKRHCEKANKWLLNIGENSIVYLALNQICIIFTSKMTDMLSFPGVLAKVIILFVVMVELMILEKVICNTKLKAVIGR